MVPGRRVRARDRQGRLGRRSTAASTPTPTRCSTCSPRAGVKATFFTLGWVAERHPALIRRIVDEGHEIASHGWDHQRVFTMDADAVPRRPRARAHGAGGCGGRQRSPAIARRASRSTRARPGRTPCWPRRAMPIRPASRRCGTTIMAGADAPRYAFRPLADRDLIELPVTVAELAGRRMATGGGFFRLLPGGAHRLRGARRSTRDGAAGGVLFPPVGDRSRPAARRATRRCSRGCGIIAGSARWRASCAG